MLKRLIKLNLIVLSMFSLSHLSALVKSSSLGLVVEEAQRNFNQMEQLMARPSKLTSREWDILQKIDKDLQRNIAIMSDVNAHPPLDGSGLGTLQYSKHVHAKYLIFAKQHGALAKGRSAENGRALVAQLKTLVKQVNDQVKVVNRLLDISDEKGLKAYDWVHLKKLVDQMVDVYQEVIDSFAVDSKDAKSALQDAIKAAKGYDKLGKNPLSKPFVKSTGVPIADAIDDKLNALEDTLDRLGSGVEKVDVTTNRLSKRFKSLVKSLGPVGGIVLVGGLGWYFKDALTTWLASSKAVLVPAGSLPVHVVKLDPKIDAIFKAKPAMITTLEHNKVFWLASQQSVQANSALTFVQKPSDDTALLNFILATKNLQLIGSNQRIHNEGFKRTLPTNKTWADYLQNKVLKILYGRPLLKCPLRNKPATGTRSWQLGRTPQPALRNHLYHEAKKLLDSIGWKYTAAPEPPLLG